MKSKVLRIVFGLTCSFCFVSLVAALPPNVVSFSLKNKGDKQTISDKFKEDNRKYQFIFKNQVTVQSVYHLTKWAFLVGVL